MLYIYIFLYSLLLFRLAEPTAQLPDGADSSLIGHVA